MPDLNSVPASPHVLASSSRRVSLQMAPPPVPYSPSLNILPSNQQAVNRTTSSSSLPSPHALHFPPSNVLAGPVPADNSAIGPGLGPIRHPRPLTAADLHLELEKEQEAVVNRLTRELSLLRAAQNSSVVSNASSTSASASGTEAAHVSEPQRLNAGSGFSHPLTTDRRHRRTSSNTSARSFVANAGSVSTTSIAGISSPAPIRPVNPIGGVSLSRQNSTASRRSRNGSPGPHASQPGSLTHSHINDHSTPPYFIPRGGPNSSVTAGPTSAPAATLGSSELSPGILPATTRYEETAYYRSELEAVKRENEALKRRVRELERMVRERRASDASRQSQSQGQTPANAPSYSRTRSDSISTTASVAASASGAAGGGGASITAQRDERPRVVSMLSTASMLSTTSSVAVGVPEDEVCFGESAASAGMRGKEGESGQGQ